VIGSGVVGSLVSLLVLDGVVLADLALVLDVGVVLLVLIDVVVDDLGPAVGQLNLVLACDEKREWLRTNVALHSTRLQLAQEQLQMRSGR